MKPTRVVVLPIGVGEHARGLGIGLAALVHGLSRAFDKPVALAQLQGKANDDPGDPRTVEALIPPNAWRDLVLRGQAPEDVDVVITGHFEPPTEGKGSLEVVAFEAKSGHLVGRGDAIVDSDGAGRAMLSALEQLWVPLEGDLGELKRFEGLGWDALESILRAERCALFDPSRGGPHDRLAALVHFGRALDDAPLATYPASRLAVVAAEAALAPGADARTVSAAVRALERAATDAPTHLELLEAAAVLLLRSGEPARAEVFVARALGLAGVPARLLALLSEARRVQGNVEGALSACEDGLRRAPAESLLLLERGVALAAAGRSLEAEASLRSALAASPTFNPAFVALARSVLARADATGVEALVDHALELRGRAPVEMLRAALELSVTGESDGLARASRTAALARSVLERAPDDPWADLALARALAQMGDRTAASDRLVKLEVRERSTRAGSEAQLGRFVLSHPEAAQRVEQALFDAQNAPRRDLAEVASRARELAGAHAVWTAYLAAGIAERRRGKLQTARDDLVLGTMASPGAAPVFAELARVLVLLKRSDDALTHATRAKQLEGESPRVLVALALALESAGRPDEAAETRQRALAAFGEHPLVKEAFDEPKPSRPFWSRWLGR